MNKVYNKYIKGISTGYIKTLITSGVGLLMVPFTLQFINQTEYGAFAIAGEIMLWLGMIELGTGTVLNSRASHLIATKEYNLLSELASTAFGLQVLAGIIIIIVGGGFSSYLFVIFHQSESIVNLNIVVFVMIVSASITIITKVFSSLLIANKQTHIDNKIGIVLFIVRTLLTVLFLQIGLKIMAIALASLISSLLIAYISYQRVNRQMPEIKIKLFKIYPEHIKSLLGNGFWATIGGLGGLLISNVDKLMIAQFFTLDKVTAFVITSKLFFLANTFHSQLFNVMRPYYGQLYGSKDFVRLKELHVFSFKLSLLISTIMASVILLVNKYFITMWVGSQYYLGDIINFSLALYFVLQTAVLPHRVLIVSGLFKMRKQNSIRIVEGILNLITSFVLVKYVGIVGIVIGSINGNLFCSTIFLNRLVSCDFFNSKKMLIDEYMNYFLILILIFVYLKQISFFYLCLVPIPLSIYIYYFFSKSKILKLLIKRNSLV